MVPTSFSNVFFSSYREAPQTSLYSAVAESELDAGGSELLKLFVEVTCKLILSVFIHLIRLTDRKHWSKTGGTSHYSFHLQAIFPGLRKSYVFVFNDMQMMTWHKDCYEMYH